MSEAVPQRVYFNFRLGEWTVFESVRNMQIHKLDHTDYSEGTAMDFDPPDIPADLDGLFIPSMPIQGSLPRLRVGRRSIRYAPEQFDRYFVELSGTFDDYLTRFSRKSRSTLRRKIRKLATKSGGRIDLREYKTPEQMKEFYVLARRVSARTYQETMLDMGLPAGEGFQQRMLAAAEKDEVRAYLIVSEGGPIAYLYCPVWNGAVLYQYLGYLQEFSDLSPGTVLLLLALERLHEERKFKLFDFTEGGQAGAGGHKEFFATTSRRCANVYYLHTSPGNLLLVVSHAAANWFSSAVGRVLTAVGMKARMKKIMRASRGRLNRRRIDEEPFERRPESTRRG